MNVKLYLGASLSMMLFAITGCSDEEIVQQQNNNIPQSNGIVFDASAGYAGDARSRTEYGDYETDGSGNKISQAIEWINGDKVSVYSPESPTGPTVEYEIQERHTDPGDPTEQDNNHAWLSSQEGTQGLQWGGETEQNFYAIYPAPSSMSNEAIRNIVSFENGKLTGYIPVNQAHTISHSGNTWTAQPVMDYLYMAAVETGVQIPTAENEQGGVALDFVPLTTTLEVTIQGTDNSAPIVSMNVVAQNGENIAGAFTCNLVNGEVDEDGYPVCQYSNDGTRRDMVTVSTYYNDNNTYKAMDLKEGESVTFNVFLLPHKDLTNLRLRIVGLNTTGKDMVLAENNVAITLHPHKKTCVTVKAPKLQTGAENNWISELDDNVLISQLSIPGTANSFSYNYRGNDPEMYKTQTMDFETQWNSGIRCFELKCPNNTNGNQSLENVELQCNGQGLGVTFGRAVQMIWEKVNASEGEFAMIIPFFESQGGRDGNVTDFAGDLNRFFQEHREYTYVTYGTNVTLGEAAKSLMFVARITSEEDGNLSLPTPVEGVFIDQWGSLKDNWARRGYMINGVKVQNWATRNTYNNPDRTPTMEYYMMNRNTTTGNNHTNDSFRPSEFPAKDESQIDYLHETTRSDGSTGKAYIQDWSRVIPETHNFYMSRNSDGWEGPLGGEYGTNRFCYWQESYNEKIGDVWRTFNLAIQANSDPSNTTFYINSLDGYFADWTDTGSEGNSAYPYVEGGVSGYDFLAGGGRGDIATYSEQINNDFYNRILDFGEDNIYGPMNIILLDRVYVGNGGTYLPSVIINNNFRFPLRTNGETTTNASYSNGGNAISNQ